MATPTSRPSASKAAASARKALRQELRACDNCRKKKIRCDGPAQINHVCTLCAKGGSDCTYVEQSISRHAPRKAYIQILESRIARTETLLHELFPHLDLNNGDLDEDQIAQARRQAPPPSSSRSQHVAAVPHSPVSTALPTPPDIVRFIRLPPASDDDLPPSDNEGDFGPLTDPPKEQLMQKSYMGKSSIIGLLSDAIDMKVGPTGPHLFKSDTSWQRPLYWTVPPYEVPGSEHDDPHVVPWDVELPPPDLLQTLIDVYFRDVNLHMPLLHRVLFEHQLATGLHKVDSQFLAVVLLVCALASRSISDPRVLAEPGQLRSAGWRYYEMAAPLNRVRIMVNGRLFDLQAKVLATIFLWGSSTPSAGWLTLGAAIGMAISVGAHRKKLYRDQPNLVDELWKRTFWMIVGLDRGLSACFGRPCGIQDESYDLDMPLEVDDVCWDLGDPSNHYPLKHEQPTDKPSVIVYFSHSIKLFQIIGFAMRTIYALNPVKTLSRHMRQHWEVRMLAELDSSLTRWSAAIPKHLHWDSRRGDGVFHRQSLALWMGWHQVRIFIHAQFIQLPTLGTISGSSEVARVDAASLNFSIQSQDSIPQSTSPQPHVDAADTAGASIAPRLGRSSMSICIESSRAMLDMVSGYLTPDGPPNGALLTMQAGGLFLASLCMLLAAWSADAMLADGFEDPPLSETIIEQLPARAPVDKEARRQYARGLMRDVQRCLDLVRYSEKFWQPGGKCWDVLNELASVEEFELCGQNEPAEGCSSPAGRRYRLLRQLFPSHYYETPDLPGAPPLTSLPSSNPWPAVAAGVAPESSTFTAIAPDADINSTGWNPFLGPLAHAHMNGPWQPLLPSSGLGYTAQISATDRLSTTNIGTEPVDPFAWLGISPYSQTAFLQPVQWRQGQQNSDWVMM